MFFDSWWQRIFKKHRITPARRKKAGASTRLMEVEALEDRWMPANITIIVTGTTDGLVTALIPDGVHTFKADNLRSAVADIATQPLHGNITVLLSTATYTLTSADGGQLDLGASLLVGDSVKITNNAGGISIIDAMGDSRIFELQGGNITLDHLELTDGVAPAPSAGPALGGAILNAGSNLTLSNDQITNNNATGYGGGVNNGQEGEGGGVFDESSGTLTITATVFGSNTAAGGENVSGVGAGALGGAIAIAGGSGALSITASTFTGNIASGGYGGSAGGAGLGGAIAIGAGSAPVSITASTFTGNIASGGYGGSAGGAGLGGAGLGGAGLGGAIAIGAGSAPVSITASTFANNTAEGNGANDSYGGGGSSYGGAIGLAPGTLHLTVVNSTLANNEAYGGSAAYGGAAFGGGLSTQSGNAVKLANDTIALNQVFGGESFNDGDTTASGGGVGGGSGAVVTVVNTIIAENQAQVSFIGVLNPNDISGAFNSLGHNLVGDTDGGSGFTATGDLTGSGNTGILNPMFVAGGLASNGGPTQTLALLATSPAINAGDNGVVTPGSSLLTTLDIAPLTTDQRGPGFSRKVDGVVDIGAFEFQMDLDKSYSFDSNNTSSVTFSVPSPGLLLGSASYPLPGGESYQVELVGSPPGGGTTLVVNPDGSFTFTVPPRYRKTIQFTFKVVVTDGEETLSTNLVFTATINVEAATSGLHFGQ
jgi:hypothetical protein